MVQKLDGGRAKFRSQMFLKGELQHLYSISYMLIMLWSAERHCSAALSLELVVFSRRSRIHDLVTIQSGEGLKNIHVCVY